MMEIFPDAQPPQLNSRMAQNSKRLTSSDELLGIHVLCIDDQQDILSTLTAILAREGAEVTPCLSGELALDLLKDQDFDVIISDLSMPPGIDGYDFAHALRKKEESQEYLTPTICLSGQALDASPKQHFADFQIYLAKPFDRKRLVDIVKRLANADGGAVVAGTLDHFDSVKHSLEVAAADD